MRTKEQSPNIKRVRKSRKKVHSTVHRRSRGFLVKLGAIAALLFTIGATTISIWLGFLLILDPNAVLWLNRYLPQWTQIPIAIHNPPQTLAAIKAEAKKQKLRLEEPIVLDKAMLFPLQGSQDDCNSNCEQILELRIYFPTQSKDDNQQYYRLLDQITLPTFTEKFALTNLAAIDLEQDSSSGYLPLTELTLLKDAPNHGIWLNLSGNFAWNNTTVTYGQIVYYNPLHKRLNLIMPWVSTAGEIPQWREVTGDNQPELVVNQTLGLEPKFKVYQPQIPNFPDERIDLREISLEQPALRTKAYRQALDLSNSGLWSLAQKQLEILHSLILPSQWTVNAQAQMDVISLHAQITESQCQQTWAKPSQQIRACLIDGQTRDALLVFQASLLGGRTLQEITQLLESKDKRFEERLSAQLKLNRADEDVKIWRTLLLAAQLDKQEAIAWLKKQPQTQQETLIRVDELLNQIENSLTTTSPNNSGSRRIIGTAQTVNQLNLTDWLQPNKEDKAQLLEASQDWYQIQVRAFYNGQNWKQAPFEDLQLSNLASTELLWQQLGLNRDAQIQLSVTQANGQKQVLVGTVKAAQINGGELQLLATADSLPRNQTTPSKSNHLAYSDGTLQWLKSGSVSLADIYKLQPEWISEVLPALWRNLRASGRLNSNSNSLPSMPDLLQDMGHWLIQPLDLTGNHKPEALLTLYEDTDGQLRQPVLTDSLGEYKPHTLVFSDTGTILYSEFTENSHNSLTAIADLQDGSLPILVIQNSDNYQIKRWSVEQQRFQ